jgi:hypothetical protein
LNGRDWQALPGAPYLGSQVRLSWEVTRLESPAGSKSERFQKLDYTVIANMQKNFKVMAQTPRCTNRRSMKSDGYNE